MGYFPQQDESDGPAFTIFTGSRTKAELAKIAGGTVAVHPILKNVALSILGDVEGQESARQGILGTERRPSGKPVAIFDDSYAHPFDRLVTQIAIAKADALMGRNRFAYTTQLVARRFHHEAVPTGVLNYTVADAAWSFLDPETGEKVALAKVGDDPDCIKTTADYMIENHIRRGDRVRSETGLAIMPSGVSGIALYSVLDLGRFNPNISVDELVALMAQNPGASGNLTATGLVNSGHFMVDPSAYYSAREVGTFSNVTGWQQIEPVRVIERIGQPDITSLVASDQTTLHALAHGFSGAIGQVLAEHAATSAPLDEAS